MPYIFSFVLHLILKRFKSFYKGSIFLPSFISMVVGSILFMWILNPVSGPVAKVFEYFGLTLPNWSMTEGLVIVVICLVTSWKVFGYNFITLFAAVSGISEEVIEAARLDDIPMHKIFFNIVLPMSSASGVYVLIMTIVQGLQFVYTPIRVMTQGGPNYASSNLIYQSYHEAFVLYRTGYSAAFSILTLVLFCLLLIVEFKFVERGVHYEN
ncbi:carbohydrate ABC transporter permease [Bacillus sp. N9]